MYTYISFGIPPRSFPQNNLKQHMKGELESATRRPASPAMDTCTDVAKVFTNFSPGATWFGIVSMPPIFTKFLTLLLSFSSFSFC